MLSSTSFLRHCKNVLIIYKNRYRFHFIYLFIYIFFAKISKKKYKKVSLRLRGRKLVFLINKNKKQIWFFLFFFSFVFSCLFLTFCFSGRQHHQSFVYHNYIILLTSHSLHLSHFLPTSTLYSGYTVSIKSVRIYN